MVAVEADWPGPARIDHYVRGRADGADGVAAFTRFPTWMWRNAEVRAFVNWLHAYNQRVAAPEHRVGFYGLDLYSLHASLAGSTQVAFGFFTGSESGESLRMNGSSRSRRSRASPSVKPLRTLPA